MMQVYTHQVEVGPSAIDGNGHVNNVEFVRWMQDAAIAHADVTGCTAATRAAGATWVVRSHHVEFLRPAFAGQQLCVRTWVADFRRAFSRRGYQFVRPADGTVLARGETEWVFVDTTTGRPKSIPPELANLFQLLPEGPSQ